MNTALNQLRGREVSSVTFVRDYLQLSFDGPLLTLINDVSISIGTTKFNQSEPGFADALVTIIGKKVVSVLFFDDDKLQIDFLSDVYLVLFLDASSYKYGPEGLLFNDGLGNLSVW